MNTNVITLLTGLWNRLWPSRTPPSPEPAPTIKTYYRYKTFWDALYGVQEGKCFHCTNEMQTYRQALAVPRKKRNGIHHAKGRATRDHIVSVNEQKSKGWHIPIQENTILACGRCNNKRRDEPMTVEARARAQAINRKALWVFATEKVATREERISGVVGEYQKNQHEREFRAFKNAPTSQWQYLFRDACRRVSRRDRIVPEYFGDLGGAPAD
jgi:hypothetical protein